ncbi:quinone-dependent dihydroorotate dehydrogenase [Agrococcus sp. SCSIO52902]|uniref:quinone-dependent dihydroorotate dehydrogenase n=1 Tax=Agrococcus sp. SCSIO52902 TaxID=2933290 RepID=UPI001FF61790|nr:quinone-dependent dihydroorotate dehydrogenase [Agrococcus sp. SCSIO52902]UOW00231.1 quinone-dependent dihydroorotate dehydrogenase [Agrococcus sp. SCSIO52902]
MTAYDQFFRHGFRHVDPERAHHLGAAAIRAIGLAHPGVRTDPALRTRALGRELPTPFGIAAGFDKDATMIAGLGALGFGHVEVGTITARPQPGNDRPRLFRLVDDRALINRMGFNNQGAAVAAERIAVAREARSRPVIGVNIGKSRVVDADDTAAVERDYLHSARLLAPVADYLAVNVSSPNTPGLRGLQETRVLEPLLAAIRAEAGDVPVLVKIAPDLDDEQVEGIAALAERLALAGVIATNTTIRRDGLVSDADAVARAGAGGLSGTPVAARSLAVLRLLRAALPAGVDVISVGGVETAAQVRERLDAGAALVQGYTGFIYRGPGWAREINAGLRAT